MICSTLSGKLAIKHPRLGVLVREDGVVLNRVTFSKQLCWTFGNLQKSSGYMYVMINYKRFRVHRLVAECFIPNPEHKPTVDHINRNRSANEASNLRWCDYKEQKKNTITYDNCIDRWGVSAADDKLEYKRRYNRDYDAKFPERKKERVRRYWANMSQERRDEINEKRRLRYERNRMKGHTDVKVRITDPRTPG